MARRTVSTIFFLLTISQVVFAQFGPDDRWNNPDGSKVDFTSTFTSGDTVTLSWKTLNQSRSDLWLTHWHPQDYPWHDQIATNIDISNAGTLQWKIDVPASTIQTDNRFVLRFFPLNAPYGILQFYQRASPGFFMIAAPNSTQSSGTSSTPTATSLSPSSTSSTTPSSSTSPPPSSSDNSLSVGAQVGIGVGVGIAVILLFLAGCFFGRRYGVGRILHRREHGPDKEQFPMAEKDQFAVAAEADATGGRYHDTPYILNTTESASLMSKAAGSEDGRSWQMNGPSPVEIGGNTLHPVEKSSTMVRPGVHELG